MSKVQSIADAIARRDKTHLRRQHHIDYLRIAVWVGAGVFCGGFWAAVIWVMS